MSDLAVLLGLRLPQPMGHEDAASGREEGITVVDYRWRTVSIAPAARVLGILTSPFLCLLQMQLLAAILPQAHFPR